MPKGCRWHLLVGGLGPVKGVKMSLSAVPSLGTFLLEPLTGLVEGRTNTPAPTASSGEPSTASRKPERFFRPADDLHISPYCTLSLQEHP